MNADTNPTETAASAATDTPNASQPEAAARAGIPSPLDALGRELLAIRSLGATLVMLCDAALTSYRLAQLDGERRTDASAGARTDDKTGNVADAVALIRKAAGMRQPGELPRTFGDGRNGASSSAEYAPEHVADGLRVPPIGGDIVKA